MRYVAFPPPSGPLSVPTSSRRALRAGVSLWSASRLRARILQRAYWLVGGLGAPSLIPGRRHSAAGLIRAEAEHDHDLAWREWFGDFDERAVYRPPQEDRAGVALLLLHAGRPRGFVKFRPNWDAGPEHRATSRLGRAETFIAPKVVGLLQAEGWTSLGFEALPGRIHSPRVSAPLEAISEEISELVRLDSPCPPGWRPMHGDMGPWNLRRVPGMGTVLFDWENVGPAPPHSDLVFYLAAARAVGVPVRKTWEVDADAVSFWRDRISQRFGTGRRDDRLAAEMMRALVMLER